MIKITSKEKDLLMIIADYQLLLIDQIVLITGLGKREVQRKINNLYKKDLIKFVSRKPNGQRGRTEFVSTLNENGVKRLQNENIIDEDTPIDTFIFNKTHNIEHQMLLNWFRIHLNFISKKLPDLTTDFLSSTNPFFTEQYGKPFVAEKNDSGKFQFEFIPDGVFYIQSTNQNKSLLFFLEVDMGTESLSSSSLKSNNISTKIKNYKDYYQSEKYKKYETKWNTKFKGFRLLFLTNSSNRKNKISDLVSSNKTNGFIWVAHQYDMFEKGLGGKFWARGGNLFTSQESILGPTLNFNSSIF